MPKSFKSKRASELQTLNSKEILRSDVSKLQVQEASFQRDERDERLSVSLACV